MSDTAQEFGARIAKEWGAGHYILTEKALVDLALLIASELRAGAWVELPEVIGRLEAALGSFAQKERVRITSPGYPHVVSPHE